MKIVGYVLLGFLALIGIGWLGTITAAALLPAGIIQQTLTPSNAIYNYEWFKDKYAYIQGLNPQIDALDAQIAITTDQRQLNQLQSQKTALISTRIRLVNEYNAQASKVNRGIFKLDAPEFVQ